jgi:hypothetical protein
LEVESVVQGFVVEDVLVVVFTVYLKACRYVGSTSGACCGVHGHQNEIKVCFFWIWKTIWDEVISEDDNFSGTIHLTGVAAVLIWSLSAVWFTSCCVSCVRFKCLVLLVLCLKKVGRYTFDRVLVMSFNWFIDLLAGFLKPSYWLKMRLLGHSKQLLQNNVGMANQSPEDSCEENIIMRQ